KASGIAMEKMIKAALKKNIKVILLTPTPDLTENIKDSSALLQQYSQQLIQLAKKYRIGLADSYNAFRMRALQEGSIESYMSQNNHPNQKGHELVVEAIMPFFEN